MRYGKISNIVYQKINKIKTDDILIYKPVPSPIDKIKNKYRWRMVLKCKVTSKVLDIIKYAIEDENIKKCKNTSVVVDINPATMN